MRHNNFVSEFFQSFDGEGNDRCFKKRSFGVVENFSSKEETFQLKTYPQLDEVKVVAASTEEKKNKFPQKFFV